MKTPSNLKYAEDHEWVRVEDDVAIVGITDYAQSQLGDIVFLDITTEGETLDKDEVFGAVEAVKTVSDLYMPASGKVIEFNEALNDAPETVNQDPYGEGWIIKIKMNDPSELDSLMSAEEYNQMVE